PVANAKGGPAGRSPGGSLRALLRSCSAGSLLGDGAADHAEPEPLVEVSVLEDLDDVPPGVLGESQLGVAVLVGTHLVAVDDVTVVADLEDQLLALDLVLTELVGGEVHPQHAGVAVVDFPDGRAAG